MPVDRALHGQVILYKHYKVVPFLDLYQWTRLLAVDEVYFPGETIYKVSADRLPQRGRGRCFNSRPRVHVTGTSCCTMESEIVST